MLRYETLRATDAAAGTPPPLPEAPQVKIPPPEYARPEPEDPETVITKPTGSPDDQKPPTDVPPPPPEAADSPEEPNKKLVHGVLKLAGISPARAVIGMDMARNPGKPYTRADMVNRSNELQGEHVDEGWKLGTNFGGNMDRYSKGLVKENIATATTVERPIGREPKPTVAPDGTEIPAKRDMQEVKAVIVPEENADATLAAFTTIADLPADADFAIQDVLGYASRDVPDTIGMPATRIEILKRAGSSIEEISAALDQPPERIAGLVQSLGERGIVNVIGVEEKKVTIHPAREAAVTGLIARLDKIIQGDTDTIDAMKVRAEEILTDQAAVAGLMRAAKETTARGPRQYWGEAEQS